MTPPPARNTTQRDRDRATIRKARPPCSICGEPIDYDAPHMDPGEFVVDHIVPINKGGRDVLDNKAPAHRSCNRAKSDKDHAPIVRRSGALQRPGTQGG